MPAASLYLFEITMLLILIPIVDRIIYPSLRYFGIDFTPPEENGRRNVVCHGVCPHGRVYGDRKKKIHPHTRLFQTASVRHSSKCLTNEHLLSSFSIRAPGNWEVLTSIPGKL